MKVFLQFLLWLVFISLILAFGLVKGAEFTYDRYCQSIEYDEAEVINGQFYCIKDNNPELFYIEWQAE